MKTRKPKLMDLLMAEPICFPGFPQIIVTRHFAYQFLTECGWNQSERGYGSLDYMVFAAQEESEPLTGPIERDYQLGQVRPDYIRERTA